MQFTLDFIETGWAVSSCLVGKYETVEEYKSSKKVDHTRGEKSIHK